MIKDHNEAVQRAVAAWETTGAIISAAGDALAELRQLDTDPEGPFQNAKIHLREVWEQAYHARKELRQRIPAAALEAIEGPACVSCGG